MEHKYAWSVQIERLKSQVEQARIDNMLMKERVEGLEKTVRELRLAVYGHKEGETEVVI